MPVERTYVGDTAYFPDLGRWVEPGDTVEFDVAPEEDDSRFLKPAEARKASSEIRKLKQIAEPLPDAPAVTEES